jgi:hypothetical protein
MKTPLGVLALASLSLSAACDIPPRRAQPGLIQGEAGMCNPAYPQGIQGTQRTQLEVHFSYHTERDYKITQEKAANWFMSLMSDKSTGSLKFVYPGQGPYDLWITITFYARGKDSQGKAQAYWGGVAVSGVSRGWLFSFETPAYEPDDNFAQNIANFAVNKTYAQLANGWQCNPDGSSY